MQTKFVLGLLLSCALLQVSLSECVPGEPSEELVAKYNGLKATFFTRLHNLNNAVKGALAPHMSSPAVQQVQSYFGSVDQERVAAVGNFFEALGNEMSPLMDRARTAALGRYETCLRPHIGELASDVIDTIKIYLDLFLPA